MADEEQATLPPDRDDASSGARPSERTRSSNGRGGTVGVLAGVVLMATVLIQENPAPIAGVTEAIQPLYILPVAMLLVALALSGFRIAQGGRDGALGRIGFFVAEAGVLLVATMLVVMAVRMNQTPPPQGGTAELMLDIGFVLMALGVAVFGVAALKAGLLARGAALMMIVSLPLGALLHTVGAFARLPWGNPRVFSLGQGLHYGIKIFALSLIWLGYSILKDAKVKKSTAASEA